MFSSFTQPDYPSRTATSPPFLQQCCRDDNRQSTTLLQERGRHSRRSCCHATAPNCAGNAEWGGCNVLPCRHEATLSSTYELHAIIIGAICACIDSLYLRHSTAVAGDWACARNNIFAPGKRDNSPSPFVRLSFTSLILTKPLFHTGGLSPQLWDEKSSPELRSTMAMVAKRRKIS